MSNAPRHSTRRRFRDAGAALLVALALAAVVFRVGTFHHGASAASQATAAALLIFFACWGVAACRDPLALATAGGGRWWSALPAAFWLSAAASWALSPVARVGESIVVFLLPAAWAAAGIGRLLRGPDARRWGLAGCTAVAMAASIQALVHQPLHEQGRAALPIGHHNQLALVLAALLPAAVLGAWRLPLPGGSHWRLAGAALVGAILAWTSIATGSMSGLLALVLQAGLAAIWGLWRVGARRWLVRIGVFLVLAGALTLIANRASSLRETPGPIERMGAVLRLEDPSLLARLTYAIAAFEGFAERPFLGWGPNAANWTLARHWRPSPGANPPGEVIADAHSLLAQAPYELGAVGSLLLFAVILRYGWRRLVELVRAATRERLGAVEDHALLGAAMLGLLGAVVCLAFGVFAGVLAVPAMLILNSGLAAAARRPAPAAESLQSAAGLQTLPRVVAPEAATGCVEPEAAATRIVPKAAVQGAAFLWLAAALAWSLDRAWAAREYERAVEAAVAAAPPPDGLPQQALDHLRAAAAADPRFPLYRARLDAEAAARAADGVVPFWLLAGVDRAQDDDRRREALERACDLDPLSALAPFELMLLERESGAAAENPVVAARAARAILAEPLLLAAVALEGDPDLRAAIRRRVRNWPGLPSGWNEAFEELWPSLDWSNGGAGSLRDILSMEADGRPAVSFSLFAFRRPPWPLAIGGVPLRSHRLDAVVAHGLPAATRLPATAPAPFWIARCGLGPGT